MTGSQASEGPPIGRLAQAVLSLFAAPRINMRDDYQLVRRAQRALAWTPHDPSRLLDQTVLGEDGTRIPVRLFLPRSGERPGVLLFFHGGGWVTGDIDTYTSTCLTMADVTGRVVCSVDYRLAPENPYPAGLRDCLRVAQLVLEQPSLVGLETAADIHLIGDSAGANLAAAVCLVLREEGGPLPRTQTLLYPVTQWDHDPETSPFASVAQYGTGLRLTAREVRDYLSMYQPDPAQRDSPLVSPLAADDLSGLPRTLVVTAEYDLLRDEGEAFAHALRAAGTPTRLERVDGALHGFIALPRFLRAPTRGYEHICSFLDGDLTDSRDLTAGPAMEGPS
ncbi:alpha/beta hydrolase [Tessaracoccus sp. OS52]|uniref:alpha/beta hydrolase n=1 Tax=Tessaracoccus sp. OS52 TaxID=2886691 RepID=UPI001D12E7BB|nr:alpha/beta hydrolase [Tessaracoccus sp. OS52]MCC2592805.1 alpha/beta hydrolase [Tessaracoccus sp. OS52]